MKKALFPLFIFFFLFIQKSFSQAERVPGVAEKKLTDSLCAALNKLDMSKVGIGKDAKSAFMDCFMKLSNMFEDVANERSVEMTLTRLQMGKIGYGYC